MRERRRADLVQFAFSFSVSVSHKGFAVSIRPAFSAGTRTFLLRGALPAWRPCGTEEQATESHEPPGGDNRQISSEACDPLRSLHSEVFTRREKEPQRLRACLAGITLAGT